ncbi:MAG: monofunctional biosynthetic peptidoglycan transglycosylase [Gammaproteobacteria bacterium]|nr:monofunctional biosynthetic peptidoglycan transglycosylase [Gammaproteobacteria bacterium]MDH5650264.1 monofunctional biosynthetic peptidoglycan transglycosylase [Gammaproteobacteria bacterium]
MLRRFFRKLSWGLRWKWITGGARQQSRSRKQQQTLLTRSRRIFSWSWRIGLLLLAMDAFYLMLIWPDWSAFKHGPVARSEFIKLYQQQRKQDRNLPPLQWRPVRMADISPHIQKAVIVAEDARFYTHSGFDVIALKDAMDHNIDKLEMKYGASTISQQTVKNMFFSASRNPLRKWHELVFTISMEFFVPKKRILETYLNIAEFGQGIFGVEAAARFYFGISAEQLTLQQATELAASLPSPKKHNPKTRTRYFNRRAAKIQRHLDQYD